MIIACPLIGHANREAGPRFVPRYQGSQGRVVVTDNRCLMTDVLLYGQGAYIYASNCVTLPLCPGMEKITHGLAVETQAIDDELRQLQRRHTHITRFLVSLKVTSRILAFTISFVPISISY